MKLFMSMLIAGAFFVGMWWYLTRDRTAWGPESEPCTQITEADRDLEYIEGRQNPEEGSMGFASKIEQLLRGCD